MNADYDAKFEEMKKYVPFLESMINRLETSGLASNPRQAQLDKIRSLRDLLMDKKKREANEHHITEGRLVLSNTATHGNQLLERSHRMKMENLLKCQQVLVNLYAKVEQRESIKEAGKTNIKEAEKTNIEEAEKTYIKEAEKTNIKEANKIAIIEADKIPDQEKLSAVRTKLKSVVNKLARKDMPNTVPEIARASRTEESCVSGSIESALFHRRPDKSPRLRKSSSQSSNHDTSVHSSNTNYTRVLKSPESTESQWSNNTPEISQPLFSRRSPKKSPERRSAQAKKERRKSKQIDKYKQSKDLNITLNVPEESLTSLNTDDIFSRIINCSDSDVDIDTLRVIRTQILGELKQTGTKDDISDLILQSYKKKSKKKKKVDEMEEGELSDSESEIIKSVYGSLVVMDKDKNTLNLIGKTSDTEETRKIQICLVINSQQDNLKISNEVRENCANHVDIMDFENFNKDTGIRSVRHSDKSSYKATEQPESDRKIIEVADSKNKSMQESEISEVSKESSQHKHTLEKPMVKLDKNLSSSNIEDTIDNSQQKNISKPKSISNETSVSQLSSTSKDEKALGSNYKIDSSLSTQEKVAIPLLDLEETVKKDVESEIDILQALKQEIMSGTSTVLITDIETPPLHLPKISKMNSQGNKKRISIENYKAKSISTSITNQFEDPDNCESFSKDDLCRKQSLKLTEKECERFNFLSKLSLNDSSEDEDMSTLSVDDAYDDMAPKSPDYEDFDLKPPIIIPNDPVEIAVPSAETDIDMRKLIPISKPIDTSTHVAADDIYSNQPNITEVTLEQQTSKKTNLILSDPRLNSDANTELVCLNKEISTQQNFNHVSSGIAEHNSFQNITPNMSFLTSISPPVLGTNRPLLVTSNIQPVLTPPTVLAMPLTIPPNETHNMPCIVLPSMTPIMTPNVRTYEMTPSRGSLESDDFLHSKHVYPPMFNSYESCDNDYFIEKQKHGWDKLDTTDYARDDFARNPDAHANRWDEEYRNHGSYQRNRCSDRFSYESQDNISWRDRAQTSRHFDSPSTPLPSFGRDDMSNTPEQIFGRPDFMQKMLGKPYGNCPNPRKSRFGDYNEDFRERRCHNDRNLISTFYRSNENNRTNYKTDYQRAFYREQSIARCDRNVKDEAHRRINKEPVQHNMCRLNDRDYESDQKYYRRGKNKWENDYRQQNIHKYGNTNSNQSVDRAGRYSYCKRKTSETESPKSNFVYVNTNCTRSFAIDTSIRKTFQMDTNNDKKSNVVRRVRASSVGRTFETDKNKKKVVNSNNKVMTDTYHVRNTKYIFRRASSVGREIVKQNKDFNDVKAELKSFKFKSDIKQTNLKLDFNNESIKDTTLLKSRDPRLKNDKHQINMSTNVTNKNIRDPRMCTKNNPNPKDNSHNRVKESKTFGIVYSNDNISKGTILSTNFGVKNYKIPKIKRPSIDTDVQADINKDYKSAPKTENSKKGIVNDTAVFLNKCKMKGKIHLNKSDETICKLDIETNSNTKSFDISAEEIKRSKSNDSDDKNDKSSLDLSDSNIEKRLTRSAKKKLTSCVKVRREEFVVKKTRDARKFYVNETSSSDDNDSLKTHQDKILNRKIDRKKNQNTENQAKLKLNFESNLTEGNDAKMLLKKKESISEMKETDCEHELQKTKLQLEINDLESKKHKNECNTDDITSIGSLEQIIQDDSNFPLDDLELFHENVMSDHVIDNINDLIADLDHDLDSTINSSHKNNVNLSNVSNAEELLIHVSASDAEKVLHTDDRDTVTKMELLIENNGIKNTESSIASENIKEDYNEQHHSDELQEKISQTEKLHALTKTESLISLSESSIIAENIKTDCSDLHNSNDFQEKVPETEILDIVSKMELLNENDKIINTHSSITSDKIETSCNEQHNNNECKKNETKNDTIEESQSNKINEKRGKVIDVSLEDDSVSNEAVVSTTATCEIEVDENQRITENILNANSTVPNRTLYIPSCNVVENSQESLPDSTEELTYDINIDVTSTESSAKEVQDPNLSKTAEVPMEIDALEKLMSLLQDKSKMRDLISKLGNQSSEKEKIMKKLEKLSELVLDDEDCIDENIVSKNTLQQNENIHSKKLDDIGSIQVDVLVKEKLNEKNMVPILADAINEEINEKENTAKQYDDAEIIKDTANNVEIVQPCGELLLNDVSLQQTEGYINKNSSNLNSNEHQEPLNVILGENPKENLTATFIEPDSNITKIKKGKPIKNRSKIKKKPVNNSEPVVKTTKPKAKVASRELYNLQKDIKEMFIKDDVLGATGIRMCRIAKMVNQMDNKKDEAFSGVVPNPSINDNGSLVVVRKCKNGVKENIERYKSSRKQKNVPTAKAGPKSKTKSKEDDDDPYVFEPDSVSESNINESRNNSDFNSDNESLSSKISDSPDLVPNTKRKIRKRGFKGWQSGIIKSKNKKKSPPKATSVVDKITEGINESPTSVNLPDLSCFTDKSYCFESNILSYSCRLCAYTGSDIVPHYLRNHPHFEIPISRLNIDTAKEAIKQCDEVNFQAISEVPSDKYTCRFCFKEIKKKKSGLEDFFWHVVSMHTGEYKQDCSVCVDMSKCPFHLDVPPPPGVSGQLLGYICGKCNFTQLSLENLKTHVINQHNDEQTEVFNINLSALSKKEINNFLKHLDNQSKHATKAEPRKLRMRKSIQNVAEPNVDDLVEVESVDSLQSKLILEGDGISEMQYNHDIKMESNDEYNNNSACNVSLVSDNNKQTETPNEVIKTMPDQVTASYDICSFPHFKVNYISNGAKEYVCCINGFDNHYKSPLLISMKKHVQIKHLEIWDGYCFMCKVIVTPQGAHRFKDCFQHYLDKHLDNFPVIDNSDSGAEVGKDAESESENSVPSNDSSIKTFINVRPLAQLLSVSSETQQNDENVAVLPIIESVVSLGTTNQALPSPSYPILEDREKEKVYKYEEAQADIMSKKHRVVLDAMMSRENLVQIFKCAGKYCSFVTNSADESLLHASAHVRVGGEYALSCVYCDYDSSGNAIDLVTHVFKNHGSCQYVCGICFYRAASSQLVQAHINRVHPNSTTSVLRSAIVTGNNREEGYLSRKDAVPFYYCTNGKDTEDRCNFRTYTPKKFCEHMQAQHSLESQYYCSICPEVAQTPAELIRHLKTHGLKLYQCTWCVYGADSESELLEHASAKHPSKQPKAYLRIITSKEGTTELKVLPMAYLNKANVVVIDVAVNECKKNPAREAERAIELEKLIGETTTKIESITPPSSSSFSTDILNTSRDIDTELWSPTLDVHGSTPIMDSPEKILSNLDLGNPVLNLTPRLTSPPRVQTPVGAGVEAAVGIVNVVSKVESNTSDIETRPLSPVVYCLDSDEEDAATSNTAVINIVDLCNEKPKSATYPETGQELLKLPQYMLYQCSKCKMFMKTGAGLLSHVKACRNNEPSILCAHCPEKIRIDFLLGHYNKYHLKTHVDRDMCLICPICPLTFDIYESADKHFKVSHSLTYNNIMWIQQPLGGTRKSRSVASPIETMRIVEVRGKRKRSLGSKEKSGEPAEKVMKYGPQDINKLPINPILEDCVHCSLCEFSTKVKINMVRHLLLHAQQQPVPETAPINPVPHLETNEKHFDKMLNLASSSISSRLSDKNNKTDISFKVTSFIPPEQVSRYPKYVPDRQRLACGAQGCAYISVDENMFKCHWQTLHSTVNNYHCVHCPPNQYLDTSRALTGGRVIAHLKMHDANLYACSSCSYYHHKRQVVESHVAELHKESSVLIVREENAMPAPIVSAPISTAPTMDLKPWQCGLCQYKSLLRAEVVEHCAKLHSSKMQYKCSYCAFRTSSLDNIPKHQSKSHAGKPQDVFYYYYREGSIPNEVDGTPHWQKQRARMMASGSHVKCEADVTTPLISPALVKSTAVKEVDLNLVKKEVVEDAVDEVTEFGRGDLGEFGDPNGLNYKCPLCKLVTEQDAEAMQSHLYEELKYRKWGCGVCSYKAYHKAGLKEHMTTEHPQHLNREPEELPVNTQIEEWIVKLIDHQTTLIAKNKENLARQKAEIFRMHTCPVNDAAKIACNTVNNQTQKVSTHKFGATDLEKIFGTHGQPVGALYSCPKCDMTCKDENVLISHLESELNKIRWFCSLCTHTFQTYHEAQFHCRSGHPQPSRPVEAPRDANLRMNWTHAVAESQKRAINKLQSAENSVPQNPSAVCDQDENSLLVVRFEKQVFIPDERMPKEDKRDSHIPTPDSVKEKPKNSKNSCPYCSYLTGIPNMLHSHILKHYNLKVTSCTYCGLNGNRKQIVKHVRMCHPFEKMCVANTEIPKESPDEYMRRTSVSEGNLDRVCLVCRRVFTAADAAVHRHSNETPEFGRDGDSVVMCCECSTLHKDAKACSSHYKTTHPTQIEDYVFCKLSAVDTDRASVICEQRLYRDEPSTSTYIETVVSEREGLGTKRKNSEDTLVSMKRVAKKSTAKPSFAQ